MIILLWALIGAGISLALLILCLPDNNKKTLPEDKIGLGGEVRELKEQVRGLKEEFKQLAKIHLWKAQNEKEITPFRSTGLETKIEYLEGEKEKQKKIIISLQEKEVQMLKQLRASKKKTVRAQEDLARQRAIYTELESQFQESRKMSEELTDGLFYELNN